VLVSIEHGGRANDTEVDVSFIVEDSATPRTTTDKLHRPACPTYTRRIITELIKSWEVYFHPWVLIAAKDYAGVVGVEEEDG
jgi:hypothetical protein